MNQQPRDDWQELAELWRTGTAPVTIEDIEKLHLRQCRRLRIARTAELAGTALGVATCLWLAIATRFLWVGVLTASFAAASAVVALRTRRMPVPQGGADLQESLQASLAYQDWLAGQLRLGRVLSFVAMFPIVMAASTQLMHLASATPSGLLATAVAGIAVSAALAWNMALAWQVWRRKARLLAFRKRLAA